MTLVFFVLHAMMHFWNVYEVPNFEQGMISTLYPRRLPWGLPPLPAPGTSQAAQPTPATLLTHIPIPINSNQTLPGSPPRSSSTQQSSSTSRTNNTSTASTMPTNTRVNTSIYEPLRQPRNDQTLLRLSNPLIMHDTSPISSPSVTYYSSSTSSLRNTLPASLMNSSRRTYSDEPELPLPSEGSNQSPSEPTRRQINNIFNPSNIYESIESRRVRLEHQQRIAAQSSSISSSSNPNNNTIIN